MRAARGVLIGLVVVVAVLIGALTYVYFSLDSIVAAAIERFGSQATQTRVEVSDVDISLGEGKASIAGLTVANPEGYSADHVFALGRMAVTIDTDTITKQPLVINEIRVSGPRALYEINKAGKANIQALRDNLASGQSAEPATEGTPIKLIIRKLIIEDGRVEGRVAAFEDREFSTALPRIELNNLGQKTNGASPAELAQEIAAVLARRVGEAATRMGIERYAGKSMEELRKQLEERTGGALREKLDDAAGGKLKDLLQR